MTTRTRATRPLLTCAMVAPRVRDALSLRASRGGFRARARRRRGFHPRRLPVRSPPTLLRRPRPPPPAAAVAIEADDASKHQPAAAKELGISVSEFAARGLEPELPPHNITHERRERRQLGQLESGWIDARATWYGGPNGAGPDGMSIYTGSCGYGKALGNHFISAWYVP